MPDSENNNAHTTIITSRAQVYLVDLDKGTFIISPGFPSVLPAHELRTLEMSLDSIVASGKSTWKPWFHEATHTTRRDNTHTHR
jgi:hypothetical protein